jgi:hypothetical protein
METDKKFITKDGYCHILPDKIVLTSDGDPVDDANTTTGNKTYQVLLVYGMLSLGSIYFSVDSFRKNELFKAIAFSAVSLYLLYTLFASRNNSLARVIDRKSIKRVIFKKGLPRLTSARFEVSFTDSHGKIKKRLIMLPGSLADGQSGTEHAYKIMVEEKLLDG